MNCGTQQQTLDDSSRTMLRERSEFGENRSLNDSQQASLNNGNGGPMPISSQYHDEPEADYDSGATGLYRCIEGKDWDGALSRLELAPIEAKTWVSRRESGPTEKVRWRLLPLHAVCIFRAPLALIEALIEVYTDGPKMKDDQGMLPVHLACRNGASKGVVLTLLSAFPESINIRDRKNRLPVDLVEASNSQNKETVLAALKKFQRDMIKMNFVSASPQPSQPLQLSEVPTQGSSQNSQKQQSVVAVAAPAAVAALPQHTQQVATVPSMVEQHQQRELQMMGAPTPAAAVVKEVDYENRTMLFRLILKKDWKQGATRALSFPTEAATWIVTKGFNGNLRFLPIHKACVLQPPSTIVSSLLEAYPEGAESKDQDGWLPIHCACFYGADADVVNSLLNTYARGANQKDEEGRLPLHYACLKGASQQVVEVLLATSVKSAMAKDDEGRLPIHHACGKGAPEAVIDALLKASPKGAQSKDDQGRLPLHHACRKSTSERVIRTLLRVYPRAAQIKDDQDKLAVHYACQHGASPAIVHLLLTTHPESINVKNGFGYTPLAEVKSSSNNNTHKEALIKLLEKFKESHDKNTLEHNASSDNNPSATEIHALQDKVISMERTLSRIGDVGRDIKAELRRGRDPEEVLEDLADRLTQLGKLSSTTTGSANNSQSSGSNGGGTPLMTKQAAPATTEGGAKSSNRSTASSVKSSTGRGGRAVSNGKKRSTTPSRGLFGRNRK